MNIHRNQARPAQFIALVATTAASLAHAGNWALETGRSQDNSSQFQNRASASYIFATSPSLYWELGGSASQTGSGEISGIPGGSRIVGGAHATALTGLAGVALKFGTGLTDLPTPQSWLAMAQARSGIPGLAGFGGRLELDSRRLDDTWLGHGVRSSKGVLALTMERWNTWGEAGGSLDLRTGGENPGAPLPLSFPANTLATGWIWASHEWTKGFMTGLSAVDSRATKDMHQPTEIVDDTARWADVPYQAPLEEFAISFLASAKVWHLTFKGNCPLYSRTKNRADDIWGQQSQRYYYWTSAMAPSSLSLGFEKPVAGWLLGAELKADSRPYKSYGWFTDKAWNQYGLTLTLKH